MKQLLIILLLTLLSPLTACFGQLTVKDFVEKENQSPLDTLGNFATEFYGIGEINPLFSNQLKEQVGDDLFDNLVAGVEPFVVNGKMPIFVPNTEHNMPTIQPDKAIKYFLKVYGKEEE